MKFTRPVLFIALTFCVALTATRAHAAILKIQDVRSPGGITAWLSEDHTIPVISLRFAFRGAGGINDAADKQGLTRLLSNTLDEGAGDLNSQAFQKILDDHAISLSFTAGRDDLGGAVKTLTKNSAQAFDLLHLALTAPRFDTDAVTRMAAANVARLRSDMTEPDWMAARLTNAVVFKGHPYALNSGGTLTTLPALTDQDLREKMKALSRDRLLVSVAGDITAKELAILLDRVFAGLPGTSPARIVTPVAFAPKAETTLLKLDIPQTIIRINLPGIRMDDPDYVAADVMNFIFGASGFGSRLMDVIREQQGLTYGIYTDLDMMDDAATFGIASSTKNGTAAQLLSAVREQAKKMRDEDVTPAEIASARSYLIGSVPLSLTSTDKISGMMLAFQRYGLPKDYLDRREAALRRITPADIRRVARRLIDTDRMTTVLVGNPLNLKPDVTVTELPDVR